MTVKVVEKHLASAYRKLGIQGRANSPAFSARPRDISHGASPANRLAPAAPPWPKSGVPTPMPSARAVGIIGLGLTVAAGT